MTNFSLLNTLNVCGFYELDISGAVLYSRPKHDGKLGQPDISPVGLDFFEKVFVCQSSENLRRRFADFVSSRKTTETFIFGCRISEKVFPLRILFVRVSERNTDGRKVFFYIDIKSDQQSGGEHK